MEAYYVINNRIPRFLIQSEEAVAEKHQAKLRESFQLWLAEKVPSNLQRRKACSQCFEFVKWLETEGICIEQVSQGFFERWLQGDNRKESQKTNSTIQTPKNPKRGKKLVDFDEFLVYVRHKVPEMQWSIAHTAS